MKVESTANNVVLKNGTHGVGLKLQAKYWELNIYFTSEEILKLENALKTEWISVSIKAGESAGSSVFWSCEKLSVSILVGSDDETWGFGVSISDKDFENAINEIKNT